MIIANARSASDWPASLPDLREILQNALGLRLLFTARDDRLADELDDSAVRESLPGFGQRRAVTVLARLDVGGSNLDFGHGKSRLFSYP
jgi:hypothetical protein